MFRSGLKKSGLNADLFDAKDGFSAINYLLGKAPYADREQFPFPDLAFVDLKMPRMDGLELLKRLHGKLGLQDLPIIVLTGSDLPTDVASAYSSRASAFHHKPPDFDGLVAMLKTIVPLWIHTNSNGEIRSNVGRWVPHPLTAGRIILRRSLSRRRPLKWQRFHQARHLDRANTPL